MKKETLENLITKNLSSYQIAKEINCSQTTIRYWLAKYDLKTTKSIKKELLCTYCKIKIEKRGKKYCSIKCQQDHILNTNVNNKTASLKTIKRYLLSIKNECSVCYINQYNNKPISLEIDHIDGNSENNNLENLRILCPNCHSQTDTYKNKNRGKGRQKRRIRYQKGNSY